MIKNKAKNTMTGQQKPLSEEIKEIRKKRGILPKEFEMMTGIPIETARKMKNGNKIIEKFTLEYTSDSLKMLAGMTSGVTEIIDDFLTLLGKKEFGFRKLASDAKFRAKFELSAYILFILDVFASKHQTHEARTEIFYVVSNEVLKSLREGSPDYKEAEFNNELYRKMAHYGVFIREQNSVFKVPSDISAWNLLQENLTNAVSVGGFKKKELDNKGVIDFLSGKNRRVRNSNKPLDIVSFAYGIACQRAERNFRLMINELFSANKDVRDLSTKDMDEVLKKAKVKISKLDEENEKSAKS